VRNENQKDQKQGNNQKVLDQELTGPSVPKINPVAEDKETVTTVHNVVQALSVELIIVEIFIPELTGLQTVVCQLEVCLGVSSTHLFVFSHTMWMIWKGKLHRKTASKPVQTWQNRVQSQKYPVTYLQELRQATSVSAETQIYPAAGMLLPQTATHHVLETVRKYAVVH